MADRFTDAEWERLGEILTVAECQLIDILRERDRKRDFDFRITIEMRNGAWEVDMIELDDVGRTKRGARGVGATFSEAWDPMGPLWA